MDSDVHEVISTERDLFEANLFIPLSLHGSELHQTGFYFKLNLGELQVHTNEKRPRRKPSLGVLLSPFCPADGP